jgi:NADH dehydrogenase FAD-containing subunit
MVAQVNAMDQPRKAKLRVVILGAGFGGMEVAKALRHVPVELIIVDRQQSLVWRV